MRNYLASCFCVCELSWSNNACNFTSSIIWWISTFLLFLLVLCRSHYFWNAETFVHTYPAMEHVHPKLFEVTGWFSNGFLQTKIKNYCRPRIFFVRYKFRHIGHNNTTLCTHFSNLSPVSVWHNKMAQCQIFRAQTALVHHLSSENRISYLYTWYIFILFVE